MRIGTQARWRQGIVYVGCLCVMSLDIAGCSSSADTAAKGTSGSGTFAASDTASSGDASADASGSTSYGFDTALSDTSQDASWATGTDSGSTGGWFDDAASADSSADVSATPGNTAEDQQKRSWRKQLDSAPLASVSLGGDKKMDLVAMRVTVQVEGLRARTVVDHIFKNPYDKVVEGRFRYALPADATVSYFGLFGVSSAVQPAFFGGQDPLQGQDEVAVAGAKPEVVAEGADKTIWGELKEARIVAQEVATQVYEEETAKKIDPALVEEVAPNTFEAKVFPIPAKGFNRVLVAYEQTLPRLSGHFEYTFVLPKGAKGAVEFTLIAAKAAIAAAASSGSETTTVKETKSHFIHHWAQPVDDQGGVLAVDLTPTGDTGEADVLSGTDPVTKEAFALVRLHPKMTMLDGQKTAAKQAIFVLDTSASEGPGRFGIDVALMTAILQKSSKIDKFQVVTFDAGARWLTSNWLANDAAGRKQALDLLDGVVLEGATDFAAALRTLAQPPMAATDKQADVFVLSDGVVNFGEASAETLLAQWQATSPWQARFFAYRTGVGADNLALFQALTRKGGAVFNCLSSADLPACAVAHEAPGILVDQVTIETVGTTGAQVSDVLVAGRQATLFPGATLTLAVKLAKPGAAMVHVLGNAPGIGPLDISVPVTLQPAGELAPRAWAEIAVAQLLETHEAKFEGLALALSQHYGIASRLGSFLVLENVATWQKYDLDKENAKLGSKALQSLIEAALAAQGKAWSGWQQLLAALQAGNGTSQLLQVDGGKLLDMATTLVTAAQLELPASTLLIPLVKVADVPTDYLGVLKAKAAFVVDPYSIEAERRRDLGQTGEAVRALTTALELNPADAEVERLIGYRVRSWQQPALASALFLDVLRKRPFEPQSYRDLATSLATDRPALAMLLYEAVLAGKWNAKFKAVKTVVEEEYALFIQGLAQTDAKHPLNPYLAKRKQALGLQDPSGDLRVTITWNTDNVDIDLWVTDPWGEKCFYSNKQTKSGGKLLDDLTQGFGPERFVAAKAVAGTYKLQAHYYGNNGNALDATTYVTATVMTHVGKPEQTVQSYDFVLKKTGDLATITTVSFK
jgi:hypothetical protein